jgi:translation initiation factor 2 alpha subunit (eIF-2alpha)
MTTLGTVTPRDMFRESDPILVRIVGISLEQQHIELSIDDVTQEEQQEWMQRQREKAAQQSAETAEE